MRPRFRLIALLFAAGLACDGDGGGGCTPAATEVCMVSSQFTPGTRTVSAGTTVLWRNGDGFTHTVTSNPGSSETFSQNVGGGATFSRAFNNPGTFNYHCMIHGSPGGGMRGTIVVN